MAAAATSTSGMPCENDGLSVHNSNSNNSTGEGGKQRRYNTNHQRSVGSVFLEHLTRAERSKLTQLKSSDEVRSLQNPSTSKRDKASALSDFYRSLATQDIESIWPKYSYLYHHQYHKHLSRRNFRQLFLSTIRSRATQGNLHRLLVLTDDMKERGMQLKCNEYDALMHWIGGRTVPVKKFRHLTEALALFDEMQQQQQHTTIQPSLVTYNTLIHIASQVSDIRMAQRLYHDMIAHEIQPDAYTYATLLAGMGRMRDVDGMSQMLQQLQSMGYVANNTVIWNAALSGYAASDRMEDVKSMFADMYRSLQRKNGSDSAATAAAAGQRQREEEGKEREKEAPVADNNSFRIYIEAMLVQDDPDTAIQALNDMVRHGLEPIAAIYNALFRSFIDKDRGEDEEPTLDESSAAKLNMVKKLYKSMLELNVTPNSDTMYTLVSALLDLGDTNLALETFVQLNKTTATVVDKETTMQSHGDASSAYDDGVDTVAALARRRYHLDTAKPSKLEPNQELLERLKKIVK
ncbi:hypothetical protein BDB00DRAFT_799336 [Zychaea mexicana]|uniref:uncharacterized protein n=1 Tax=Zychaea mexicana TaxID=64656 RepID=UPI0022FEDD3F|nr:uncharacterized protein BDB00DRAFT_799336 [Zychaea mexicana]KAI9498746.1 hypothetical protein BDB00DRAFT_799336 [Zychaea mexicana]